jgi:hypothetical protein
MERAWVANSVGGIQMNGLECKRLLICIFLCILLGFPFSAQPEQIRRDATRSQTPGADLEFKKIGILTTLTPEDKMKIEVEGILRFSSDRITVSEKKTSKITMEIPYTSITKAFYEPSSRHRVAEGAAVGMLSLGTGLVVMTTKTKSHWLAIDYSEQSRNRTAILHIGKDVYADIINAIESRTGKKVEMLQGESVNRIAVTQDSKNVDKVVDFNINDVRAAVKHAMEEYQCSICNERENEIECKRSWGEQVQELYGVGGEKITARLDVKGSQTHVRITTGKGILGRAVKRNWSTPIFNEMIKNLESGKAEPHS